MNFPEPATLLHPADGDSVVAHPTPSPPLVVGRTFGGYRILRVVGGGGMGQVYEAFDAELNRSVALKVMRPERAADPDARERFVREARALAAVSNPHVVTIHHVSQHDGHPFLVMELVAGEPLDTHLRKGPLPLLQLLHSAREIAGGLGAAHRAGVVHRDVKPDNVVLSAVDGRAKLVDFGLAHTSRPGDERTATVGTPFFMAPEQVRGAAVTTQTDLFSLGVLLYRMATGRGPFDGASVNEWKDRLLSVDPPTPVEQWNPSVPPPLASLIHRLLEKEPADRPESAWAVEWELSTLLQSVASQSGVYAAPPRPDAPPAAIPRPSRPRRRLWAAVLVGVATVALGGGDAAVLTQPGSTAGLPISTQLSRSVPKPHHLPKQVRLFDGQSLAGWHGVNGRTDQWAARDGVLVGTLQPDGDQFLLTDAEFGEFVFAFEFRWPDQPFHVSVMVLAAEEQGEVTGLEVNMNCGPDEATDEEDRLGLLNPLYAAGGVHMIGGPSQPVQNVTTGKWNKVKVTHAGGVLGVEWNGRETFEAVLADHAAKVKDLPAVTRTRGAIALRTHGGPVIEYRNLCVRELK
jgi:serine/threonine protein kinase